MSASSPASANSRRDTILAAARDLFHRQGFHAVGVDEIGVAAGISGPGVYRHFPGKASLLVALFDSITGELLAGAEAIQKADHSPEEALERLVSLHAATAVAQRALVAVWLQDRHSLPAADAEYLQRRQAEYVSIWRSALTRVRPELAPAEAEAVVHAALGAVNSVALHDGGLPGDRLEGLLARAARAVLAAA